MAETLEHAREGLEHAEHEAEGHGHAPFAIRVAILISILAALLAFAELGEKNWQNQYLTHHVSLSDDYAFYQAKTIRSSVVSYTLDVLDSLPDAQSPAVQKRIADLRAEKARLDDDEKSQGRKQLLQVAENQKEEREHAFHRYHGLELTSSVLQIAIVLASVAVVTRIGLMAWVAGGLGLIATVFGLLVVFAGVSLG